MLSIDHKSIWTLFLIVNIIAFYVNSSLVVAIIRLYQRRTSIDVLIGGLSGALMLGVASSGAFSLYGLLHPKILEKPLACRVQSTITVASMIMTFICIALIAHRTYMGVVQARSPCKRRAFVSVVWTYILGSIGTIIFGLFSPTYLVASRSFCFYQWNSIVIYAFFCPTMVIASILTTYRYYETYRTVIHSANAIRQYQGENEINNDIQLAKDIAVHLSSLLLLYFICGVPVLSLTVYEISGHRANAVWDIICAVMMLVYCTGAPILYAQTNKRLGWTSVFRCGPPKSYEDDALPSRVQMSPSKRNLNTPHLPGVPRLQIKSSNSNSHENDDNDNENEQENEQENINQHPIIDTQDHNDNPPALTLEITPITPLSPTVEEEAQQRFCRLLLAPATTPKKHEGNLEW